MLYEMILFVGSLDVVGTKMFRKMFNVSSFIAKHYLPHIHCVSKNDIDVAHYNFDADQPILIIFGRDVAERVCYQTAILFCYPASPN